MFRNIIPSDYDKGIIELLGELTTINKDNITREQFSEWVNGSSNSPFHYTLVLEEENRIIACGTILIEPKLIHDMGFVGHIEDVVVKKEYRGKGLGKEIIEKLIAIANEKKCYKVILDCSHDNVHFYEKCGLENKGVQMAIYN